MPREINDGNGRTWSCVQAYAGLQNDSEKQEAASVEGKTGKVYVVCTPSGGAQTVRLEIATDWENSLSDQELLSQIEKQNEINAK